MARLTRSIETRTQLASSVGAVACGHPAEASAATAILEAGGNAFDAVVAAAFVAYVVEPAMCGLGGSGHFSGYLAAGDQFVAVDHNIRAAAAAHAEMFQVDPDEPPNVYCHPGTVGRAEEWGYRACGVPGAVAGACEIHARYGRLPFAEVIQPAISEAERGVPIDWRMLGYIVNRQDLIRQIPATAALLLPGGIPLGGTHATGDERLALPALAETLRRIAADGRDGFYRGDVARAIASHLAEGGGLITADDLASYEPKIGSEAPASYRGLRYATCGDAVSVEALNIVTCFDFRAMGADSTDYRHLMAEALGQAFADNLHYFGDPEATAVPLAGLLSAEYGRDRANALSESRAAARPLAPGDPWSFEPGGRLSAERPVASSGGMHGTSFAAVADAEGNLASLCTTVDTEFGCLVFVPEVGIFMNNSMQDFDPRPGRANSIAPRKMPMFGVPTLVAADEKGGLFAAASSGGYRITTAVLHSLIHVVDFEMGLQEAVDHPRVDCVGGETFIDARIPDDVRDELGARGHSVIVEQPTPWTNGFGRVGAVLRDAGSGVLQAASAPAWVTAGGVADDV